MLIFVLNNTTTIGAITFILNTVVIWAIVKTKEWENRSSKLILIGSCYSVFGSVVISTLSTVYMAYNGMIECMLTIAMLTPTLFSIFALQNFISVIAFDRLMRVIYLQNYTTKFNACK